MVSFTSDSTIHGVTYIFGPNRSIYVRIFWICLFILSIFGLFYYIRGSYTKWRIEPDIITKNKIRKIEEFPKYAVTICPKIVGGLNFTKLREKSDNYTMTNDECTQVEANSLWCRDAFKISENCNISSSEAISSLLTNHDDSKYFFRDEDKILGRKLSLADGVCSTFGMYSKGIFKEDAVDEIYGLVDKNDPTIEWSPDSDYNDENSTHPKRLKPHVGPLEFVNLLATFNTKNVCNETENSYKFIIHQANEIPTRFHESINIEYGKLMRLTIKIKSERSSDNIRFLHPDVRKCYFEDEGNSTIFRKYSMYHCLLECFNRRYESCDDVALPRRKNASKPFCQNDEDEVEKTEDCKCHPNCNRLLYKIVDAVDMKNENYTGRDKGMVKSMPFKSLLKFSYASSEIEDTERFATYTLPNFIADIGGYLGLFLGCSLLSIVEIAFFFFEKLFYILRKLLRKQNQTSQEKDLSEVEKLLMKENQMMQRKIWELEEKVKAIQDEMKRSRSELLVEDVESM